VLGDDEDNPQGEGGEGGDVHGLVDLEDELGALPDGEVAALLKHARDAVEGVDDEEDDDEEDGEGVSVGVFLADGAEGGEDDVDGDHVDGADEVAEGRGRGEEVAVCDDDDVEEDADEGGRDAHVESFDDVLGGVGVHVEEDGDGAVDVREAGEGGRDDGGGEEERGDDDEVDQEAGRGVDGQGHDAGVLRGDVDDGLGEERGGEGEGDLEEELGPEVCPEAHAETGEDEGDDADDGDVAVGVELLKDAVHEADHGKHDGGVQALVDVDEVGPVVDGGLGARWLGHCPGAGPHYIVIIYSRADNRCVYKSRRVSRK